MCGGVHECVCGCVGMGVGVYIRNVESANCLHFYLCGYLTLYFNHRHTVCLWLTHQAASSYTALPLPAVYPPHTAQCADRWCTHLYDASCSDIFLECHLIKSQVRRANSCDNIDRARPWDLR